MTEKRDIYNYFYKLITDTYLYKRKLYRKKEFKMRYLGNMCYFESKSDVSKYIISSLKENRDPDIISLEILSPDINKVVLESLYIELNILDEDSDELYEICEKILEDLHNFKWTSLPPKCSWKFGFLYRSTSSNAEDIFEPIESIIHPICTISKSSASLKIYLIK